MPTFTPMLRCQAEDSSSVCANRPEAAAMPWAGAAPALNELLAGISLWVPTMAYLMEIPCS